MCGLICKHQIISHNTEGEIPCLKNPLQTLFTPRKTLHYHYTIDTMLLDWAAVKKKKKNPRKILCSNNPLASWCFMHFISTTSAREHSELSFLSGFQFHHPPMWAPRSHHGDFWKVQKCSLLKCNSVSQQLSSFPPASLLTTSFPPISVSPPERLHLSTELGVFPLSGGLVLAPCSSACKHRLIPELPKNNKHLPCLYYPDITQNTAESRCAAKVVE